MCAFRGRLHIWHRPTVEPFKFGASLALEVEVEAEAEVVEAHAAFEFTRFVKNALGIRPRMFIRTFCELFALVCITDCVDYEPSRKVNGKFRKLNL